MSLDPNVTRMALFIVEQAHERGCTLNEFLDQMLWDMQLEGVDMDAAKALAVNPRKERDA